MSLSLLALLTSNQERIQSHEGIFDVGFVLIQLKEEIRSSAKLSFRSVDVNTE